MAEPLITVYPQSGQSTTETTALSQPPFQSQQSFVQRLIDVQVTLSSGPGNPQPNTFATTSGSPGGPTAGSTLTLSGLRTTVRITNGGNMANCTADIFIYGMTPTQMNQLSAISFIYNKISRNIILVTAGDATSGMSAVFKGTAVFAVPEYNKMPEVPFYFQCQGNAIDAVTPAIPLSYTGPTSVATMMQGLAGQMNLDFENNGITAQLSNPYYPGNAWTQFKRIAEHAYINGMLVDGGTKLAIWPKGGYRTSLTTVPLISPNTGMVGYPTFNPLGQMFVKTIFNPQVKLGGNIQVQSSIPQANGTFTVRKLDLTLESMVPHGQWLETAMCYPKGFAAPPPK